MCVPVTLGGRKSQESDGRMPCLRHLDFIGDLCTWDLRPRLLHFVACDWETACTFLDGHTGAGKERCTTILTTLSGWLTMTGWTQRRGLTRSWRTSDPSGRCKRLLEPKSSDFLGGRLCQAGWLGNEPV